MSNRYQQVSGKIFSEDFLIFLETIPKNNKERKKMLKTVNKLAVMLKGEKLNVCILSVAFYLSAMLVDNDINFAEALEDINKIKGEFKVENYIQ